LNPWFVLHSAVLGICSSPYPFSTWYRWARLFKEGQLFDPVDVDWDYCEEPYLQKKDKSVLNCSRGWQEFVSLADFDKTYESTPAVP
jgi:hypothetical protein